MSSVGMMNISLTIIVVFKSRMFRKKYIDFSNNTFPIDTHGYSKLISLYMGNLIYS